jgi:DNA-directed RNA polymerase subunit beta'
MKAKIKFLDADKFKQTSCGEVVEPSTINFRTRMPHIGGLLCPIIFGPTRDYCCNCNPPVLRGRQYNGMKCEKCGVTLMSAKERRERTGHIEFPSPCVHPLAYIVLADTFGISYKDIEKIISGKLWVGWAQDKEGVVYLRNGVKAKAIVKEKRDMEAKKRSSMALFHMAREVDLEKTAELQLSLEMKTANFLRLTVEEGAKLENLFITTLPVMPVAYRPYLDKIHYIITSSKNDLYARIFWKKLRFQRLRDLFPMFDLDIIIQEETTLLQKALNDLMLDGTEDVRGVHLKSILDDIKGKYGLVRNKLLGKRADFSGRSVISPGPWLKIDEMGLPKKMGVELFKPWIQKWLKENYGLSIKQSGALYKDGKKDGRLYEALEEVVENKRVVMNRAPTLHRIGMLAFKIRLHDGHSCLLHPMVCAPYNADFDGDQMAVHVPLGRLAWEELKTHMMPIDNMLSPLDSSPVIGPSHEMIIGAYHMTRYKERSSGQKSKSYSGAHNLISAHNRGEVAVNEEVTLLEDGGSKRLTCAGRIMVERLFKVEVNEPLTKRAIKKLISEAYDTISKVALQIAMDKFKDLAYHYVSLMGFSLGMEDFRIPSTRDEKMAYADRYGRELGYKCDRGEITEDERVESKIRQWMATLSELQDDFIEEAGPENPLVVMLETGARVSMTQVSQLVVSKGMQARANGSIMEDPVYNCLMTGVNTFEYFMTSYGARKSMADKKNATPISGYMARRLVNLTRDFYISVEDCGNDKEGLELRRCDCAGRTTTDGELIEPTESIEFVKVRSPIFCTAERGICAVCYGIDATKRRRVEIGEPVGIIAAQSLTEPCTQMTMRTFHTSGAAELKDSPLVIRALKDGIVKVNNYEPISEIYVGDSKYLVHAELSKILVQSSQVVKRGEPLAVYVSKNLSNEDIGGKLSVLDKYFEMPPFEGFEAVVAQKAGVVQLVEEDDTIGILIGGEVQGKVHETPVFVCSGEEVRMGQFLSFGEVNIKSFEDDITLAGTVFVQHMLELYGEEGVHSRPVHLEMIFRGLSELVEDDEEEGKFGLFRYGEPGTRRVMGATEIGRLYPSWLKAIGFGYSKTALTRAAINYAVTYDLPTERIMMGGYPLFDAVEPKEDIVPLFTDVDEEVIKCLNDQPKSLVCQEGIRGYMDA